MPGADAAAPDPGASPARRERTAVSVAIMSPEEALVLVRPHHQRQTPRGFRALRTLLADE